MTHPTDVLSLSRSVGAIAEMDAIAPAHATVSHHIAWLTVEVGDRPLTQRKQQVAAQSYNLRQAIPRATHDYSSDFANLQCQR